jgi:hypothetical protein
MASVFFLYKISSVSVKWACFHVFGHVISVRFWKHLFQHVIYLICLIIYLWLSNADSSLDCIGFGVISEFEQMRKKTVVAWLWAFAYTFFRKDCGKTGTACKHSQFGLRWNPASTAYECYHWVATFGSISSMFYSSTSWLHPFCLLCLRILLYVVTIPLHYHLPASHVFRTILCLTPVNF